MPQFTLDADLYTLEEGPFNDMILTFRREVMYRAVRKFLQAVLRRIPVRTGFLRGAFSDIRQRFAVGGQDPIYDPQSSAGRRVDRGEIRSREYYYTGVGKNSRILKTTTSGIPFATPADRVLTFNGTMASFELDVRISYYRINDFYSRIAGSPWNSLQEGAAAMINELEQAANMFPAIERILTVIKIRQKGQSVSKTEVPANIVASRILEITGF